MNASAKPWSESHETRKQIARFLVIGGLSVLTDLIVYLLFVRIGTGPHLAKAVSYVSGMVIGFVGNKLWTFESSRRSVAEPITYALLYVGTLVVNVLVNGACLEALNGRLSHPIDQGLAFLVATGLTTVLNFLGMKFVTFRGSIAERRSQSMSSPAVHPAQPQLKHSELV